MEHFRIPKKAWIAATAVALLFALTASFAACLICDDRDEHCEEADCMEECCLCACALRATPPLVALGSPILDDCGLATVGASAFVFSDPVCDLYRPPRTAPVLL